MFSSLNGILGIKMSVWMPLVIALSNSANLLSSSTSLHHSSTVNSTPINQANVTMKNVEQCRVDLSAFIFRHRTDILWHHFSLNQGHHRADATQSILD
jgi:hypothetical protein